MLDIVDTALECFECPVCTKYMTPPVRKCILGHSVCGECFGRVVHCPICRSPKSNEPAWHFESFFEFLPFPCKFRHSGCTVTRPGKEIIKHIKNCTFGQQTCPFTLFLTCNWKGARCNVFDHCMQYHRRHVTVPGKSFSLELRNFDRDVTYFTLILRKTRIFILSCRVHVNKSIYWRFIEIGPPGQPSVRQTLTNPTGRYCGVLESKALEPTEDIHTVFDRQKCRRNDVATTLQFINDVDLNENSVFFIDD